MKKILLFCIGESGAGKTTYIQNNLLQDGLFYNLRSFATRSPRHDEKDGEKYFFVSQEIFEQQKLVTHLWVNQDFWTPEKTKWMYGVPEFEIYNNIDKNFVYDVIEPRYARQMKDWFIMKNLNQEYDMKVAWFVPPKENNTITERANMQDDTNVRHQNTCNIYDIFDAFYAKPDFILQPRCGYIDQDLTRYISLCCKVQNK